MNKLFTYLHYGREEQQDKKVIIVDTMWGGGGGVNENRRHSVSRIPQPGYGWAEVGYNKVLRREPYSPDSAGPTDRTINNA